MAFSSGGPICDQVDGNLDSDEDPIAASSAHEELRLALILRHGMIEIETERDGNCLWACLCLYLGMPVSECRDVRSEFVSWMVRVF
jgi:hypothetical protein